MKIWLGLLAAGSLAASGTFAHGQQINLPGDPTKVAEFACAVRPGPALANCTPKSSLELPPAKVDYLRQLAEATLPCFLTTAIVGKTYTEPVQYLDVPTFWAKAVAERHVIINPDWAQKPTIAEFQKSYPPLAAQLHISGSSRLRCTVMEDGTLSDCNVLIETPEGYGFGEASLKLAESLRFRPMLLDCKPVGGSSVTIPFSWFLQGEGATATQPVGAAPTP